MMDDKALSAALLKLHGHSALPASQFTPAQRRALDAFARHTGAVRAQSQGRGAVYTVVHPAVLATHAQALSPSLGSVASDNAPVRARHIADARNSKAGAHRHATYYLLLKACSGPVVWHHPGRGTSLPLSQATQDFGAATLVIDPDDGWATQQPLWLVENQALFDRTDWLPQGTAASMAYYGGQLHHVLLQWLGRRPRAPRVVFFADYDGVGLVNFARLHAVLGDACEFWLMPDWATKLERYGNPQLWRDTLRDFSAASGRLPHSLEPLVAQMQQTGKALEQEAVWLAG
jgi:hypothetical protein